MMKLAIALGAALGLALSMPSARAAEVVPYTVTSLAGKIKYQLGRLSRARPPSDFSVTPTPFPGFVNLKRIYGYKTVAVPFAPNAFQDIYYEITVDDPDAALFASAYDGTYDKNNPSAGYLGDEGSSGNYFPGDPSYFDIVVPRGGSLLLLFNGVSRGIRTFAYQVSAFSDSSYDEEFRTSPVPEPATWLMLVAGFGLIGGALRRRVRDTGELLRAAAPSLPLSQPSPSEG